MKRNKLGNKFFKKNKRGRLTCQRGFLDSLLRKINLKYNKSFNETIKILTSNKVITKHLNNFFLNTVKMFGIREGDYFDQYVDKPKLNYLQHSEILAIKGKYKSQQLSCLPQVKCKKVY